MPVLGALANRARYRDPDFTFLRSSQALTQALGSMNTERRIRAFGKDLLEQIEKGKDISQKDFINLVQKNKLKPQEADFALNLLTKSGAVTKALRKAKIGKTKLGKIAGAPLEATAEELSAFPSEVRGAMFPKPGKAEFEQLTIYGPNKQTMRIPVGKGTKYVPPKGWSLSKPEKDPTKKVYTEREALKEVRNIEKMIIDLEANRGVDPAKLGILALTSPDLAAKLAEGADIKSAIKTLKDHKEYLYRDFVKKERWPGDINKPKSFIGPETDWKTYK